MIFMSQSGITDPSRESDWSAWYIEHLKLMASVPGISSAQRFTAIGLAGDERDGRSTPGFSPSLAMYSVASPDVFKAPYYLSVRGMGEWLPLIDKRYYRRNLFKGLDDAPDVSQDEVLLVTDRSASESTVTHIKWMWLECAGIDFSTAYRGVAVVSRESAEAMRDLEGIVVYRPATLRYRSA